MGMHFDADERYRRLFDELGSVKRWYQTRIDVPFAAVVAAVDDVDGADVVARREALAGVIGGNDELSSITYTLAAVSAARGVELTSLIAAADTATELLRTATRSSRIRRIAGAILAADDPAGCEAKAGRAVRLHQGWNQRHRIRTNASDLLLAAVSEVSGADRSTALDRASVALDQLGAGGYRGEWEVARILALDDPTTAVGRYLGTAPDMSRRRRKPVADRRAALALACLADHPLDELRDLLRDRVRAAAWGMHRPDSQTALMLGALLTLGASVPPGHRLRDAFHGFALRSHYGAALAQAPSG